LCANRKSGWLLQ